MVDRRADIYSLGCLLYMATTGQRPFGSGATALGRIIQGKYAPPSEVRANYPLALEQIIKKALSPSPDDRYQTAEEMRLAFEAWLQTLDAPVTHAQVAALVAQRLSAQKRGVIDALLTTARVVPEELAFRLLPELERSETPTAQVADSNRPSAVVVVHPEPSPPAAPATGSISLTGSAFRESRMPWRWLLLLLAVAGVAAYLARR